MISETMTSPLQILDGPMGTELNARGVPTPLPGWSAHALQTNPEIVQEVHRDYARAGATIHTTNTFRTHARQFPDNWQSLTAQAVDLARAGIEGFAGQVAGSVSPLEDCYRPDLSPAEPRMEHRAMARCLAESGVDLLLVETFSHSGEALIATQEAIDTGLPTWLSLTAGPETNLLSMDEIRSTAEHAIRLGTEAIMVNCVPAAAVSQYLEVLRDLGIAFGAYGNTGYVHDTTGWQSCDLDASSYQNFARQWVQKGASILGGCCGTGIGHIQALAAITT